MVAPISDKSLEIIRATTPLVKENALKITSTFYPKMLGDNPHLYKYFNEANQRTGRQAGAFSAYISGDVRDEVPMPVGCPAHKGASDVSKGCPAASAVSSQSKTLADAVVAYATNIEQLENLSEAVERICHKHCALGITPEDYLFVHDNFMEAIGEVLGDVVTPDIAAAWSEALMALAKIFINTEESLYTNSEEKQWLGVKEFEITEIINEAIDVKSFRFQARDGTKKGFLPGQFITIFEKPDDKEYYAPRHYTVTSQPDDDYYQVTVKRLVDPLDPSNESHNGFYSNFLHSRSVRDIIHCGAVYGPNLLAAGDTSRVAAFVSTGIGLTPTKAMLPTAIKTRPSVAVFHGNSTPDHQAYRDELEVEVKKAGGTMMTYYSHVEGSGRMTGQKIIDDLKASGVDNVTNDKVDFFICAGGQGLNLSNQLLDLGIKQECLRLEYFGPFNTA